MKQMRWASTLSIGAVFVLAWNASGAVPASHPAKPEVTPTEFAPLLPDLTITKIEVVPDKGTSLIAGQKAWVKVTWQRTGPQPTAVFRINSHIDHITLGLKIGSTVDHITMGTTLATPWIAVRGAHTVTAFVDCGKVVSETDETNNKASISILVGPAIVK